jgi:acyl-CoA synthetase (AMP-forming)/AMP-acid ligase II
VISQRHERVWHVPGKVADLIVARAAAAGGSPAYVDEGSGRVLTWAGVAAGVDAWHAWAGAVGLRPGIPVALLAEQPLAFVAAYLGLLSAGAVVLALDPTSAPHGGESLSEAAAAIAGFGVAGVVTDGEAGVRAADEARVPAWVSAPELPHDRGRGELRPAAGPVRWAEPSTVLMRTSGTTGRAKGVPLHERQLLHNAAAVARHHRLGPGERLHSALPLFHINAQVVGVLAALVSGSSLVVSDRFHRTGFWDVLAAWEVTVLNAVPAILALLAEGSPPPDAVVRRVRFARSASAPLPLATLQAFQERCGIGALETYGMTEAAGQICANPLPPEARRPGSVGPPVGVELRLVDERGRPVPAGEPGAVELRGPSVATAYVIPGDGSTGGGPHRRLARNAAGWLPTGDVGSRDVDGFLTLLGRGDGVINRGGEKVYPREVEEVLRRDARVADAIVLGEPDPVLGERPVAVVVARGAEGGPDLPALRADLVALCQRELSRHKQPARIDVVDRLPATPTGKVRRDEVRAMLAGSAAGTAHRGHPR